MELKDLEKMKVDELRAEASKLEGVDGVKTMKKQELIDLLCEKLNIQRPEEPSKDAAADEPAAAETESQAETKADAASETEAEPVAEAKGEPAGNDEKPKPEKKAPEKKVSPYKAQLKALQAKRKQALADRDQQTLADARMRIKRYKRKIKKESGAAASSS